MPTWRRSRFTSTFWTCDEAAVDPDLVLLDGFDPVDAVQRVHLLEPDAPMRHTTSCWATSRVTSCSTMFVSSASRRRAP